MNSLYPVTAAACVTLPSNTGWPDSSCLLYSDDTFVCEVPAFQGLSFILIRKEVAATTVPIKQIDSFSCVDMSVMLFDPTSGLISFLLSF